VGWYIEVVGSGGCADVGRWAPATGQEACRTKCPKMGLGSFGKSAIWVPGELWRWDRELRKRLDRWENVAVIGIFEDRRIWS
jgi:hypothetical protein